MTNGAGRPRRPSITGSVSNVLNRPDHVTATTRDRVQAAIDELGFVRNASARHLREGRVRSVGAIVLDIANPSVTEVARGIEDLLADEDYTLMPAPSDEDPAREGRYLRLYQEHGVEGLLVTPSTGSFDAIVAIRRRGLGVVLLDAASPVPELSSVGADDVRGAELAAEHLLGLGHRRIAFLNGPDTIRQCVDRCAGPVADIVAAGLDPAAVLIEVPAAQLNADGVRRRADVPVRRRWS